MIGALWAWLTGQRRADEPEPPRIAYDPDRDPLVRAFRLERRQSERATRHIERRENRVEAAYLHRRITGGGGPR